MDTGTTPTCQCEPFYLNMPELANKLERFRYDQFYLEAALFLCRHNTEGLYQRICRTLFLSSDNSYKKRKKYFILLDYLSANYFKSVALTEPHSYCIYL